MISRNEVAALVGATAYSSDGEKVGKVGQLFFDDQSGEPAWATVSTGLFGMKQSFVPLDGAELDGSDVRLAADKDMIKNAPKVDPDGDQLSEDDERELYRFYGVDYGPESYASGTTADEGWTWDGSTAYQVPPGITAGQQSGIPITGVQEESSTSGGEGYLGAGSSGYQEAASTTADEDYMGVGSSTYQETSGATGDDAYSGSGSTGYQQTSERSSDPGYQDVGSTAYRGATSGEAPETAAPAGVRFEGADAVSGDDVTAAYSREATAGAGVSSARETAGPGVDADTVDRLEQEGAAGEERFRVRLRKYMADPGMETRPVAEQAQLEDDAVSGADVQGTSPPPM